MTQVPRPVSPRSRSRVGEWDTGAEADVRQRCRDFTHLSPVADGTDAGRAGPRRDQGFVECRLTWSFGSGADRNRTDDLLLAKQDRLCAVLNGVFAGRWRAKDTKLGALEVGLSVAKVIGLYLSSMIRKTSEATKILAYRRPVASRRTSTSTSLDTAALAAG